MKTTSGDNTARPQALQQSGPRGNLGEESGALLQLKSLALNKVREAAFLIDEHAALVYVNDEACRSLGYRRAQLLEMSVLDIDPHWDADRWNQGWARLRESGSLLIESVHRCKNGHLLPVEIRATYFEYEGAPYNLSLVRDVSERKRTEELLLAQLELEAQFRQLAENTPDIICRYDRQCRLIYANSGLAKVMRAPMTDLLGKTPVDHTSDPQFKAYQAALASALETGKTHELELTLTGDSGDVSYHQVRIIPEPGIGNEFRSVLALGRDITQRKWADARLHASEQAFRALVEHSPDYIARFDRDLRRVYVNPALRMLMRGPVEGAPLSLWQKHSPLVDVSTYAAGLLEVVQTGTGRIEEVRFRNASGEVRWGHLRLVPELAADGRVASVLSICRDIDELKRSEQAFRTLTENFPDFVARFDRDCRHTYVNPRLVQAFGIPQENFIGKRLHELALPGDSAQYELLEAGICRAFAEGEPNGQEARWHTSEGHRVFEVRHVPEKDADGAVVSVLGIARDVTRLRNMEMALRASEEGFRTLAENAPQMIARFNRNGRYSYVNPAFEEVSAVRAADALGKPATSLPGATPELGMIAQTVEHVIASGTSARIDVTWQRDGKAVWWHVSAVPERNAAGAIEGVLTIWTDITERMEDERRLAESYALLQELTSRRETAREDERKRIAREMHDELGQQLTALRMGISTMLFQFAEDRPELAARCQHLLGVVDQTLAVVRNVVTSLRPAALDAGIVAALEWLTAEFSRDTGIGCKVCMPSDDLMLRDCCAVALFRIVQEALTNVMRHAAASTVEIELRRAAVHWVVEVRDDGRGFNVAQIPGRSFGLAGMKERALMLGGELLVVSLPGKGTTIRVRIPINDGSAHPG